MTELAEVTRYSDISWPLVWEDEAGTPINLTGWSASIAFATEHAAFAPAVSITDAATGSLTLSVPWNDAMPETVLAVRIRLTNAALPEDQNDEGLPEIKLRYV